MEKNTRENYEQIGLRIRDVRKERKMSQAQLADKANVALPTISDIERGKSNMSLGTFIRIIEALQVSADFVLRADVPEVNQLYQSELSGILSDCNPTESRSIISAVLDMKKVMHQHSKEL